MHEYRDIFGRTYGCRMSTRLGAQQQPVSRGGSSSRGRFQSGFVPASVDTPSSLPPERSGATWLVNVGGSDTVEMTGDEIAEAWREGRLDGQTLVWRQGLLEWTALCTVPQLSISLDRRDPVREAGPEDISEDELTELWAPPAAVGAPRMPALEPRPAIRSEPEQLPEDEVTELWGSGPVTRQTGRAPPPPSSPYDAAPERLAEDEVTELWGSGPASRQSVDAPPPPSPDAEFERLPVNEATRPRDSHLPDLAAREAASLPRDRIDSAPSLTFEEIDYDDEQLAEDEVTALWAEHNAPSTAHSSPRTRAASGGPAGTVALRGAPPRIPARVGSSHAGRPTQPSMFRVAEMHAHEDRPFASSQPFDRPAGITTIAFWADGVRGLHDLISTRLEGVVDRVVRVAEHRGGAARRAEGFQSRTAVFLTEMRTVLTDVLLAAVERLGLWAERVRARIADRVSGRSGRRRW
jgi:hypothetical protein